MRRTLRLESSSCRAQLPPPPGANTSCVIMKLRVFFLSHSPCSSVPVVQILYHHPSLFVFESSSSSWLTAASSPQISIFHHTIYWSFTLLVNYLVNFPYSSNIKLLPPPGSKILFLVMIMVSNTGNRLIRSLFLIPLYELKLISFICCIKHGISCLLPNIWKNQISFFFMQYYLQSISKSIFFFLDYYNRFGFSVLRT